MPPRRRRHVPILIEQGALYIIGYVRPQQFHSGCVLAYAHPDWRITVFKIDGAPGAFWEKAEITYDTIAGVPRFSLLMKIAEGGRVPFEAIRALHEAPTPPPSFRSLQTGYERDWSGRRYLIHLLRGLQDRNLITVTSFPQLELEIARETLTGMQMFNNNRSINCVTAEHCL